MTEVGQVGRRIGFKQRGRPYPHSGLRATPFSRKGEETRVFKPEMNALYYFLAYGNHICHYTHEKK